jgi:uncharacterized protein YwgA
MRVDEVVLYICKKYPIPDELSKARITKLVYLADWESCLRTGEQLTNIKWYFHNFGPYVDDVVDAARKCSDLQVIETENFYGEKKEIVGLRNDARIPNLNRVDSDIIDSVIESTKRLYWNDFIEYVYNTPPVRGSDRHTDLNLVRFARNKR